jgi:hypothetical protein
VEATTGAPLAGNRFLRRPVKRGQLCPSHRCAYGDIR